MCPEPNQKNPDITAFTFKTDQNGRKGPHES